MTSIQRWFVALMLVALASPAGAGVRYPVPGVSAAVSHQQTTDQPQEQDELEEDEEPDCE